MATLEEETLEEETYPILLCTFDKYFWRSGLTLQVSVSRLDPFVYPATRREIPCGVDPMELHQTNSSSSSSSSSSTTTSTTNGTAISRQIQKIADQLIISKLQTRDGKYKMTDTAATIQDATHILNEVTHTISVTGCNKCSKSNKSNS